MITLKKKDDGCCVFLNPDFIASIEEIMNFDKTFFCTRIAMSVEIFNVVEKPKQIMQMITLKNRNLWQRIINK